MILTNHSLFFLRAGINFVSEPDTHTHRLYAVKDHLPKTQTPVKSEIRASNFAASAAERPNYTHPPKTRQPLPSQKLHPNHQVIDF